MKCPKCGARSRVYTTRSFPETIQRTRVCGGCGLRFKTWEVPEDKMKTDPSATLAGGEE